MVYSKKIRRRPRWSIAVVLPSVCAWPLAFGSTVVQQKTGRMGSGIGKTSMLSKEGTEDAGLDTLVTFHSRIRLASSYLSRSMSDSCLEVERADELTVDRVDDLTVEERDRLMEEEEDELIVEGVDDLACLRWGLVFDLEL